LITKLYSGLRMLAKSWQELHDYCDAIARLPYTTYQHRHDHLLRWCDDNDVPLLAMTVHYCMDKEAEFAAKFMQSLIELGCPINVSTARYPSLWHACVASLAISCRSAADLEKKRPLIEVLMQHIDLPSSFVASSGSAKKVESLLEICLQTRGCGPLVQLLCEMGMNPYDNDEPRNINHRSIDDMEWKWRCEDLDVGTRIHVVDSTRQWCDATIVHKQTTLPSDVFLHKANLLPPSTPTIWTNEERSIDSSGDTSPITAFDAEISIGPFVLVRHSHIEQQWFSVVQHHSLSIDCCYF
jgi:hypothetical protein